MTETQNGITSNPDVQISIKFFNFIKSKRGLYSLATIILLGVIVYLLLLDFLNQMVSYFY